MTQASAPLEVEPVSQRFSDLDISPQLKKGIKDLGYVTPTAFQKGVFDNFQNGKNIVGEGQSSYGKSLAFSLPILAKIAPVDRQLQALIICDSAQQTDLTTKECRALGRHLDITVGNASNLDINIDELPHILVLAFDDLAKANIDALTSSLHTVFFDGLSTANANQALDLLARALQHGVQILIFGKDTLTAFKDGASDLINEAVFVSNNDQPKIAIPAKHIFHQPKETEPKPRALLAVMELHRPKVALITCNEASECELLARYLSRYGYKTKVVSEEANRLGMSEALRDYGSGSCDALVCQNSLLVGQGLENVAFMVNYDMFDRPQTYEQTTQFSKQAPGLQRTIVNLLTSRELGCLGPIKAQCLIDFTEMPLPADDEVMTLCAQRLIKSLNKEAEGMELGQFEVLAQKIFDDQSSRPALSFLLKDYLLKASKPTRPEGESEDLRERRNGRSSYDRSRPDRRDRDREVNKSERGPREHGPNEQPNRSSGTPEGSTRLYVTLGRRDGLNDLASLAQYLSDKSGVDLGHFSGTGMLRDHSAHIEVDDDVAADIITTLHNSPRPGAPTSENGEEPNLIICEKARQSVQRPHHRRPMQRRRSNFQRRD